MEKERIKGFSVIVILAILILPLIQFWIGLFQVKPLQGAVNKESDVLFTKAAWYDESYQKGKEKYLNQEFGFRNTLVRLNNQVYYALFKIAKANGVVIGKNNYLYEENYIKDYYGINYIGQKKIDEVTKRLTSIDSVFKTLNKTLLVVFAPGKASYYPEYIPDNYEREGEETNYKGYRKAIAKSGIKYIDFNEYFISQKNKSKFLLYPKTGIHWSDYGAIISLDSINRFLAKTRNYRPVEIYWTEYVQQDSVSTIDSDIENGMNLLFEIKKPKLTYPILKFNEEQRYKPKVLNVGDSFYWNVFAKGIAGRVFDNASFGYYFKEIHSPLVGGIQDVANVNLKEFINKHEVVMLMCTEATICNFPFDFDTKVYNLYCTKLADPVLYKQQLEAIKNNIRSTPEWIKAIEEKAKAANISLEEQLNIDADYMINHQN